MPSILNKNGFQTSELDPILLILLGVSTIGYYSTCLGGFGAEVRDQSGAVVQPQWG